MIRKLVLAVTLAAGAVSVAAPAMADRYCGPGYYLRYGECRPYGYREGRYYGPVGGAVAGAGYVAGSAVNAAGNVAGAAVGTAGAIVGGVLGGR